MIAVRYGRFLRRFVIAVVIVLLLSGGYLGSVVSTTFASSAGWIPNSVRSSNMFFWYIMPGCWYASLSGWPGSDAYRSCLEWSMQAGRGARDQG